MTRPKRIDLPYTLYHVFSRSNSGDLCFPDVRTQEKFLWYLAKYTRLFSFRLHCFCLMPNHFHLLLESLDQSELSEFMRRLLTAYTVYFNKRYQRHGHLFQGRFKSLVVDKANYLLALSRYIHLNPREEHDKLNPDQFTGSSLRYYLNGCEPDYLYTKEILNWFGGDRTKYAQFIREGIDEDTKPQIIQQRYVGTEAFQKRMIRRVEALEKKRSRSGQDDKKHQRVKHNAELEMAQKILHIVAEYYQCRKDNILNGKWKRGRIGKARIVLLALLRECLPWRIRTITEYLHISSGIYVYFHRLKSKPELIRDFESIMKTIHDITR